jgi:hypothetical protein
MLMIYFSLLGFENMAFLLTQIQEKFVGWNINHARGHFKNMFLGNSEL